MKKGKFNVIIGAQSGREDKDKLSTFLMKKFKPDMVFPFYRGQGLSVPADDLQRSMGKGLTILCVIGAGFDVDAMALSALLEAAGVTPESPFMGDVYGVLHPYIEYGIELDPYDSQMIVTWEAILFTCGCTMPVGERYGRYHMFDWNMFAQFAKFCSPNYLCVQDAELIDWGNMYARDAVDLTTKTVAFMGELENVAECEVAYVGTGPQDTDMVDRDLDNEDTDTGTD